MEIIDKPFDLHILVCTNTRVAPSAFPDGTPPPPMKQSCGPLGADEIRGELKAWLYNEIKSRPLLAGKVRARVNGSGCLDFCKKGIAVAIYPQSDFMLFVKNSSESVKTVKEQILKRLSEIENQIR